MCGKMKVHTTCTNYRHQTELQYTYLTIRQHQEIATKKAQGAAKRAQGVSPSKIFDNIRDPKGENFTRVWY